MCEHAYKSIALGCIMDSHYDTLHCNENEIATYAQSICQFWKKYFDHIQCILSSVKFWLDMLKLKYLCQFINTFDHYQKYLTESHIQNRQGALY